MVVFCSSSLLLKLRGDSARGSNPRLLRLTQRISELMAASSLADVNRLLGTGLQLLSPPPSPEYSISIGEGSRLVLAPHGRFDVDDAGNVLLAGVASVKLLRIAL